MCWASTYTYIPGPRVIDEFFVKGTTGPVDPSPKFKNANMLINRDGQQAVNSNMEYTNMSMSATAGDLDG